MVVAVLLTLRGRCVPHSQSAIEQHKARRKKDATTLMTMVFKKAAVNHRTRALDDDLVVAFNAVTNQVLRYVRCLLCCVRQGSTVSWFLTACMSACRMTT